jgi:hypothetical protein
MDQAVSDRSLTMEAWVHAQVSPCESCGAQSSTGTAFSQSSLVFPVNIIPLWLSTLIYHLGDEE